MLYSEYDEFYLGPSPASEESVQVDKKKDYLPAMREELRRWKKVLEEKFPVPEGVDAHFKIKMEQHEFGSYGEVVIRYNVNDEKSVEFALNVENTAPAEWPEDQLIKVEE